MRKWRRECSPTLSRRRKKLLVVISSRQQEGEIKKKASCRENNTTYKNCHLNLKKKQPPKNPKHIYLDASCCMICRHSAFVKISNSLENVSHCTTLTMQSN